MLETALNPLKYFRTSKLAGTAGWSECETPSLPVTLLSMLSVGAIFKFVSRKHSSEKLEREGGGLEVCKYYSPRIIIVINSPE